jgi:peptidoglycan/xylan/chitin deacetylase (PgdA/CDA1 family)
MKLNRNPLVIFCYHGLCSDDSEHLQDFCFLPEEKFTRDLDDIARSGWSVLNLSDAVARLSEGNLSSPSVALTFDDGFAQTIKHAEPLLRARSMQATVFVATELMQGGRAPWFTNVIRFLRDTSESEVQFFGHTLSIRSDAERRRANQLIQSVLKELHPKAVESLLMDLADALGVASCADVQDYQTLNAEQCASVAERGIFGFGAHSASHAIHTKLSRAELEIEIADSVRTMRDICGEESSLYAYPNGRRSDFSDDCKFILRKQNVTAAFSTIPGWHRDVRDFFAMRRFCVGKTTSVASILNSNYWKMSSYLW